MLARERGRFEKALIIVEGVYSMDGDICNLPAFIALKRKYGCLLMVDEAHSFGICGPTGCGLAEHFDLEVGEVDLWMGTLSKSLASCGGWIAGSKSLVNYLRYTAPGFVYSAGITPANAQRLPQDTVNVNITGIGGWPLLQRSALPVEVESVRRPR